MEIISHAPANTFSAGTSQGTDMTVGNAKHLFALLSSNLYGNPKKAAIREIVTNAWDAHIEAGITDTPIQITTAGALVIRDFGKGIPASKFMKLYGQLGSSTKQQDNRQTGGLGIGKLAPLSCQDVFSVRSFSEGVCTTYQIANPTRESDTGVPTVTVVHSRPTEETGLEVTLNKYSMFLEFLEEVITYGAIKATLDGKEMDTVPDVRFALCRSIHHGRKCYVRYGNNVYPALTKSGIHDLITCGQTLILRAEPGSLRITPNRESIIWDAESEAHLLKLGKQAYHFLKKELRKALTERGDLQYSSGGACTKISIKSSVQATDIEHFSQNPMEVDVPLRVLRYSLQSSIEKRRLQKIVPPKYNMYKSGGFNRFYKELYGMFLETNAFFTKRAKNFHNVLHTSRSSMTLCRSSSEYVSLFTAKNITIRTGTVRTADFLFESEVQIRVHTKCDKELLKQKLASLFKQATIYILEIKKPKKKTTSAKKVEYKNFRSFVLGQSTEPKHLEKVEYYALGQDVLLKEFLKEFPNILDSMPNIALVGDTAALKRLLRRKEPPKHILDVVVQYIENWYQLPRIQQLITVYGSAFFYRWETLTRYKELFNTPPCEPIDLKIIELLKFSAHPLRIIRYRFVDLQHTNHKEAIKLQMLIFMSHVFIQLNEDELTKTLNFIKDF